MSSSFFITPSALPKSTITFPYSNRLIIPLSIWPCLSIKSSYCLFFSASLTLVLITCLALCAAILPKSTWGNSSKILSPIFNSSFFELIFFASLNVISLAGSSTNSTISKTFWIFISPLSLSMTTSILLSLPNFVNAAFWIALSIEPITSSLSIDFSFATASTILKSSNLSSPLFNIFIAPKKKWA